MVEAEVRGSAGSASLVVEGKPYGVLEASEAGLRIVEATDRERQALVEAGYALPADVATSQEE